MQPTRLALLLISLFPLTCGAAQYDTIINNGRIIDGAGNPWYRGSVAVKDGRVAAVGQLDADATAPVVIDARERYVTPGFIDVHTHCDEDLVKMPMAENFIRMGVTSVVAGNCGGSVQPLSELFTSCTTNGIAVNAASLIGHNTVRSKVMGNAGRDPVTTEIEAMKKLVDDDMRAGAVGLSSGLIYAPGVYTKTPEIAELAKVVGKYHGIYTTHMRSESAKIVEAIDEALSVGLQAKIPVHISHLKIVSPKLFGHSGEILRKIEKAREAGQDVTFDQYLYAASSTGIGSMLPDWASEGTSESRMARLRDPETRRKIRDELVKDRRDSGRPSFGYAYVANFHADPSINGKSILDIASLWKKDTSWEAQGDVILDIVTSGGASMVFWSMSEDDVTTIAKHPLGMFASDSGIREMGVGVPHPRGYGNNARALAKYVRDDKVVRLEDAVRRMTSYPAQTFGFADRGLLRPGAAADIVVFDLDRVKDASSFDKPHAYSEGFDYVLVNGRLVIDDGRLTGQRPGKVLYGAGRLRE